MPLHPQVAAMLAEAAKSGLPPSFEGTPEEARENSRLARAAMPVETEPVGDVEDRTVPGPAGDIPVRVYRPEGRADGNGRHPLVMLYHGGGWVVGDLDNEDVTCRGLCVRTNSVVISVDYRLAPETPFPGGAEDCYAATAWAAEHADELGIDATRMATSGTSAGGNLAGAVALMARDRGGPAIAHQVLFCPVIDCDFDRPSYIANATEYGLTRDGMMWFWDLYTGNGNDRINPYASLIRAQDLSGLPDATIIVAEYDPLLDEAVAYGEALAAAGVDTLCSVYAGMTHGFNIAVGIIDAAKDALDEAAERINASFASS